MARKKDSETVKSTDDLPKWCSPDLYKGAINFSAVEWYRSILERRHLYFGLGLPQSSSNEINQEFVLSVREDSVRAFHELTNDPLRFGQKSPDQPPVKSRYLGRESDSGVRDMTVSDLRNLEGYLSPGRFEYSRRWAIAGSWYFAKHEPPTKTNFPDKRWIYESLTDSFAQSVSGNIQFKITNLVGQPLVVDTDLSDSALRQHFEEWLQKARRKGLRAKAPKTAKYERKDFDTWIDRGYLPYMDLKLWELVSGKSIPDRVIADLFSISGEITEKKINDTIRPFVMKLLNPFFSSGDASDQRDPLALLGRQAGFELGRKSDG